LSVSGQAFRDSLRHVPAAVSIVTVAAGGRVHGLTVSAFASVSPRPPLISIMIDQRHGAWSLLEADDAVFAVNVLGEEQRELADRFAWVKDEDRFAVGTWEVAVTGAPVLTEALAWLDCTVHTRAVAGTHSIYVGEVQASHVGQPEGAPLVYWNRDYRRLAL